jgi:acyl-CoA reductase-like NAD-dependent aldehyde dehydrogenase
MPSDTSAVPLLLPFIGGRFVETAARRTLRAPYDGRVLAEVCECGPGELDAALRSAERALSTTARLTTDKRVAICAATARGIEAQAERLALAICDDAGKPIADAQAEVVRARLCFELAAAEALTTSGEGQVLPMDLAPLGYGRTGILRRFPIGPVAAISPFNFPLNLAVHKVAPALAAGCPIVLKPASQTPTVALLLAEIITEAGWPEGALSVVPAMRAAADVLVTDDRCKLLTFTGSAPVGWDMKARAGKKKVTLELGGNAAVILDETISEADLPTIIPKLIYGAYSYSGQKCISIQRVFVVAKGSDRLYRAVCERMAAAVAKINAGDPHDPKVLVGPLIDEQNARRVESWISEAAQLGGRQLCGGVRQGTFVPPTLLAAVPSQAQVVRDEVFGPVCVLDQVPSFAAAIAAVNDSRFGLQAAVFTRDLGHALAAHEELAVGAVILNEAPSFRIDHMPYGGIKDSGLGREGIRSAIVDMTEPRLLITGALRDAT